MMKRKIIIVLVFILVLTSSFYSCSVVNNGKAKGGINNDIGLKSNSAEYDNEKEFEVVEKGNNYVIKKKDKDYLVVSLIDNNGYTINSYELYYWRHPKVTYTEEGNIDFTQSFGSGITAHQYYSFDKDVLSRLYLHVACYKNGVVCCYNADNNSVVVRNVFDAEDIDYENSLPDMKRPDYSLTAIKSAEFLNSNQILITYYSGETGREERTTIINVLKG